MISLHPTVEFLISAAKTSTLSLDAFKVAVALNFDCPGSPREPGDTTDTEAALRIAFVENQFGSEAAIVRFRLALSKGEPEAAEAMNTLAETWESTNARPV